MNEQLEKTGDRVGGHLRCREEDQSPPRMEEAALVWPREQSRWPVPHKKQPETGRCWVRETWSQAPSGPVPRPKPFG